VTEEGKEQVGTAPEVVVRCAACSKTFAPDLKLKTDPWYCPHCEAKNPNLRRLYRGVADVFILGLFFALVFFVRRLSQLGPAAPRTWISGFWILFLLFGVIRIYRAKAPWRDGVARTLIWLVFVLVFILNVIVRLFFLSSQDVALVIGSAIVYGIVFIYILWVLKVSRRAMLPEQ